MPPAAATLSLVWADKLTSILRSDKWSRMNSLILSTVILLVFTALTAGSYYHGDAVGMFNMLTAWRFFVSDKMPHLLFGFPCEGKSSLTTG